MKPGVGGQPSEKLDLHWDSWDNHSRPSAVSRGSYDVSKPKTISNHVRYHRDESASPKHDSNKSDSDSSAIPTTPTSKTFSKVDSISSSPSQSSGNSIPPPSPGVILSPPVQVSLVNTSKFDEPSQSLSDVNLI